MVLKEFEGAGRDLETARKSFNDDDYKWATIQAYYSIFHAARGLLYNRGFREKSHRGLLAAIRLLYSKQLSIASIEDFSEAMRLREEADYGLIYSEESAIDVIESAEIFLGKCRAIVGLTSSRPRSRKSYKIGRTRGLRKTLRDKVDPNDSIFKLSSIPGTGRKERTSVEHDRILYGEDT